MGDAARFVWPRRCWLCGAEAEASGESDPWCPEHTLIARSGAARCGRCAAGLAPGLAPGSMCAKCRRRSPVFAAVVAPFSYRHPRGSRRDPRLQARRPPGTSRRRWRGRRPPSPPGVPGPFDLLVPVPSHPSRILSRGYDPPRLLARELEAGRGRAGSGRCCVASAPRRPRASPGAPGSAGECAGRLSVGGAAARRIGGVARRQMCSRAGPPRTRARAPCAMRERGGSGCSPSRGPDGSGADALARTVALQSRRITLPPAGGSPVTLRTWHTRTDTRAAACSSLSPSVGWRGTCSSPASWTWATPGSSSATWWPSRKPWCPARLASPPRRSGGGHSRASTWTSARPRPGSRRTAASRI